MVTKLEHALTLAAEGFYVFPLEPDSKIPAIDAWQKKATRDPEKIQRWWTDPVMDIELDRNIGIFTGMFKNPEHGPTRPIEALLVIDVDVKADRNGEDSLKQLTHDLGEPLISLTASGGRHLIYIVDKPVKQGTNVLGPGLDIRSHGGYIVAPGSVINGKMYRWQTCTK